MRRKTSTSASSYNVNDFRGLPFCVATDNATPSAVVVFLFLAGLWFTGAIINGPNFLPQFALTAQTIDNNNN